MAPAIYGSGSVGAVVFIAGGSFSDLIEATRRESASAVWAQDANGIFHLLIIDGPEFLKAEFYAAFPNGFPNYTAMTVVKQGRNEASPEGPGLSAPSVPNTGSRSSRTYTVSGTDTLSEIGSRFGVSWMDIATLNGITGPNYVVRPGQSLRIPN